MLSSDLAAFSGNALGCGVSPAGVESERAEASSEAEDSGTGEWDGAVAAISFAAASEVMGAAGGIGSLVRGALTDVSPVNGFLYSVWGVMTSTAVGL